jgi:hypothetical protein
VLRDLNSSNGTYVNGEIISEVVLRPGDNVQCGTVYMKFEPGVKRPKLNAPDSARAPKEPIGQLKTQANTGTIYYQTLKLPTAPVRPRVEAKAKEDSVYVKGESAISYEDLAKPEVKRPNWLPVIIGVLIALAVIGGACYYFLVLHHAAH